MRLQLHHCPLPLWRGPSGLWGETTHCGDSGRGGSEWRQKAGPQAALQGAQRASCTPRQQQHRGAAISVQQQGLIDQLLDNVHFLSPVQVWWRRLLGRLRGARGGAVSILRGVAERPQGMLERSLWWFLMFVIMWCHLFPFSLCTLGLLLRPLHSQVHLTDSLFFSFNLLLIITVLQSFVDCAEARGWWQ